MGAVELIVAIGHEYQGPHLANAAPEQPEHIQRRLIRPVHILDREDGRP